MPLLRCDFLAIFAILSTTVTRSHQYSRCIRRLPPSEGSLANRSGHSPRFWRLAVREEAAWPRRAASGLFLGWAGGRRCPRGWGKPRSGPGTGLSLWISDLFPMPTSLQNPCRFLMCWWVGNELTEPQALLPGRLQWGRRVTWGAVGCCRVMRGAVCWWCRRASCPITRLRGCWVPAGVLGQGGYCNCMVQRVTCGTQASPLGEGAGCPDYLHFAHCIRTSQILPCR